LKKIILILFFSSLVWSGKAPLKISYSHQKLVYGYLPVVKVTSVTDKLIVNDIIVNRGNCGVSRKMNDGRDRYPFELKYGQHSFIGVDQGCNILEIIVKTNHGDWTRSY
jgi:hypothetical protein